MQMQPRGGNTNVASMTTFPRTHARGHIYFSPASAWAQLVPVQTARCRLRLRVAGRSDRPDLGDRRGPSDRSDYQPSRTNKRLAPPLDLHADQHSHVARPIPITHITYDQQLQPERAADAATRRETRRKGRNDRPLDPAAKPQPKKLLNSTRSKLSHRKSS
jgi:hypothetical protein